MLFHSYLFIFDLCWLCVDICVHSPLPHEVKWRMLAATFALFISFLPSLPNVPVESMSCIQAHVGIRSCPLRPPSGRLLWQHLHVLCALYSCCYTLSLDTSFGPVAYISHTRARFALFSCGIGIQIGSHVYGGSFLFSSSVCICIWPVYFHYSFCVSLFVCHHGSKREVCVMPLGTFCHPCLWAFWHFGLSHFLCFGALFPILFSCLLHLCHSLFYSFHSNKSVI